MVVVVDTGCQIVRIARMMEAASDLVLGSDEMVWWVWCTCAADHSKYHYIQDVHQPIVQACVFPCQYIRDSQTKNVVTYVWKLLYYCSSEIRLVEPFLSRLKDTRHLFY